MLQLEIRKEARDDIFEIAQYYNYQQAGLGYRFIESLDAQIQRIRTNPPIFSKVTDTVRRALIPNFPHLMFY
jgi:hypothetical protein